MTAGRAAAAGPPPYGQLRPGIYRRRILITTTAGRARADLEDDPHRHGVEIRHVAGRITDVRGEALRVPWSACPGAVRELERLAGMALSPDPLAVYRHTNAREHCTHLLDVAGLAIAHAARGIVRRRYDAEVPVTGRQGAQRATLYRDGERVLEWQLADGVIIAPERFAGRGLRRLLEWAREACADPDDLEAVAVLRRAVHISNSRLAELDLYEGPAAFGAVLPGACFLFQRSGPRPAQRMRGSTRDFTDAPEGPLSDLS